MVEAPAQLRPWVAKRYGRLLQTCAAAVLGDGAKVDLVVAGTPRELTAHAALASGRVRPSRTRSIPGTPSTSS